MIDWRLARRIARSVAGGPGAVPTLPGDLDAMAADAERRVVAYTGLTPSGPLPAPEAVGRPQWADINIEGMAKILDPVADRLEPKGALAGVMRPVAGTLIAAEVGGLTGLLSQRVLGQYELVLLDPDSPTRLLFVAPNLLDAAQKLAVDREQLVAWVAFHEVTHAVQFTSVPWLREHLAGLLRQLLDTIDVKIDWGGAAKLPSRADIEELVARVRQDGLVMLMAGPERRALIDQLQAVMAVIEGHAEHVMDAVGRDVLSDLDELRSALNRRRADRSGMWRVLEKLLGLEMKLRQYEVGKRFCDVVVEKTDVETLHRVFESPESLPTWAELQDPDAWLARAPAAP
ncbi:MAG TPA: zinc-dependent metalloprotease [Solirubrobacteraceae bacterium]|jgi:coenzyme F420 biosynthesis associated uncharacterized protein